MLVLSTSTDEQPLSRSTNAQNSGPAPLAPFAADVFTAWLHPEEVALATGDNSACSVTPINKTWLFFLIPW